MIRLNATYQEKEIVKGLGAKWDGVGRFWYVPPDVDPTPFKPWIINFDPQPNSLPEEKDFTGDETVSNTDNDVIIKTSKDSISLFEALRLAKNAIAEAFPTLFWVEAEISSIKNSKGNLWIDLIEIKNNQQIAKVRAVAWSGDSEMIQGKFQNATGEPLKPGIKTLLKVYLKSDLNFGLTMHIHDINPSFTLGKMAEKLLLIRKQLVQENIYHKQKLLKLPEDFHKVAVISPHQAAGLHDFKVEADLLEKFQLCHFEYFNALFQGANTENEISACFKKINTLHFDAIIIIRGGGAKSDLDFLNTYEIAKSICESKIPVICGIGHQIDKTIIDEVSCLSQDTPSKVAAFLTDTIINRTRAAENFWKEIFTNADKVIINKENKCKETYSKIQNKSELLLGNTNNLIMSLNYKIQQLASAQVTMTDEKLKYIKANIHSQSQNMINTAETNIKNTFKNIIGMGPEKTIQKGYCVVYQNNKVITSKMDFDNKLNTEILFKDGKHNIEA